MRFHPLRFLLCLLVVTSTLACGGGDNNDPVGPGPDGNDTHYLRAKIDGTAWSAPASAGILAASHIAPGLYIILGQPTGDYRMEFTLSNITGVGTFPLGVSAFARGGTVALSQSPATWRTPLSGAAGSITFTELSDTLVVGTFAFEARAVPGSAVGTKQITEGEFRIVLTTVGVIGPIPDNAWSEVRATVAGSPWNAAHIATSSATTTLSIVAFNETRSITITLAEVQGVGTYTLSSGFPIRSMTEVGDGVDPLVCCWGMYGTAGGSVTITSLTSTRMRGTFEATLEPSAFGNATGSLVIASGTFDNGLLVAP